MFIGEAAYLASGDKLYLIARLLRRLLAALALVVACISSIKASSSSI
jgi:hypothetical protein